MDEVERSGRLVGLGRLDMYVERSGSGGIPLIVIHGGYGTVDDSRSFVSHLAPHREVVTVELEGHGRTGLSGFPLRYEHFAQDLNELCTVLGFDQVDVMGYSLGGHAALRFALDAPERVRRGVLVSVTHRHDGWFPEVRRNFATMGRAQFEMFSQTPLYERWVGLTPEPERFPELMDLMGALLAEDYDWSEELERCSVPLLLVYADSDAIAPSAWLSFWHLLGGGLHEVGAFNDRRPTSQLAVIPGRTHYDVYSAPLLPEMVSRFLA
jgi:pimeloyl-ACP methyl ester carboxylesterase